MSVLGPLHLYCTQFAILLQSRVSLILQMNAPSHSFGLLHSQQAFKARFLSAHPDHSTWLAFLWKQLSPWPSKPLPNTNKMCHVRMSAGLRHCSVLWPQPKTRMCRSSQSSLNNIWFILNTSGRFCQAEDKAGLKSPTHFYCTNLHICQLFRLLFPFL